MNTVSPSYPRISRLQIQPATDKKNTVVHPQFGIFHWEGENTISTHGWESAAGKPKLGR